MSFRKGQEEIVGFVVVVVLIAIVALVFLSFSLHREVSTRTSVTLTQFVEALSEYTTTCSLSAAPDYASVGELYRACYQGTVCADGASSCLVLNQTLLPLLDAGLKVGSERPLKGYQMRIVFLENRSTVDEARERPFFMAVSGNCSEGQRIGASDFRYVSGGTLRASLTTCT